MDASGVDPRQADGQGDVHRLALKLPVAFVGLELGLFLSTLFLDAKLQRVVRGALGLALLEGHRTKVIVEEGNLAFLAEKADAGRLELRRITRRLDGVVGRYADLLSVRIPVTHTLDPMD